MSRSSILAALASWLTPDASGNIVHGAPPAQFDNSGKLATTGFVQRALGSFASRNNISSNQVVPLTSVGGVLYMNTAGVTATLPLAASVPAGGVFIFESIVSCVIARGGTDSIFGLSASVTSISLGVGDTLIVESNGLSGWSVVAGSAQLPFAPGFGASLASNGYQKLPSGLITQWGSVPSLSANSSANMSYPIVFPNGILSIQAVAGASLPGNPSICGVNAAGTGNSKAGFSAYNSSTTVATQGGLYLAIGY